MNAVLIGAVRDDDQDLPGLMGGPRPAQAFENSIIQRGSSTQCRVADGGFDFARIRRQICRQLYMVIERQVEILAAFTRRLHKSHSRFLGALKLCVIRHAVASVEQNSERDRLLFVREKFNPLRYAIVVD